MITDQLAYRIAFASLKGMNQALAGELLARLGSEEAFFNASEAELSALLGCSNHMFRQSVRQDAINLASKELDFIYANRIKALYYTDPEYPSRMLEADDAPLMVYALGKANLNEGRFVSIVGTRHATPYGIDFVGRLVEELQQKMAEPLTVVSGLAFGIDAAAHAASLKACVPTVGVLAHGLNTIYPAQHRQMAADMVRGNGMVLTEYMSSSPIHKGNFVARNRIVAAMTDCTIVAESASKGGALITANLASGYNRDVFALPGRTSDRYSAGCNQLIHQNIASLIENADQLIDAMRWRRREQQPEQQSLFPELTPQQQAVIDLLTAKGEAQLNQITIALNDTVGRTMSLLIDMEFKGLILTYPGGKYRLGPAVNK